MMQNGSEEGDGLTTNGCLSSSGLGPIHVTVTLVRTSYEQPSLEPTHSEAEQPLPVCLPSRDPEPASCPRRHIPLFALD